MTVTSSNLLGNGYPPVTYSEIEGDKVVRHIYVLQDGTLLKDSLDLHTGEEIYSLADSAPRPEHNRDDGVASVEMCSKEEFERIWSQAIFVRR